MAKDNVLDSYLLLPCCEDGAEGRKPTFSHSVAGWFEVENKPLRIDTVLFVGSRRRLRTQMLKREGIDIDKLSEGFAESFKGVSGLTFSLDRKDGSSFVVIWMPRFDWSIIDVETLCHECLHASVMVMRMSGVKSRIFTAVKDDDVDDEGLCYRQATMLTNLVKKMVGKQNRLFKKGIEGK